MSFVLVPSKYFHLLIIRRFYSLSGFLIGFDKILSRADWRWTFKFISHNTHSWRKLIWKVSFGYCFKSERSLELFWCFPNHSFGRILNPRCDIFAVGLQLLITDTIDTCHQTKIAIDSAIYITTDSAIFITIDSAIKVGGQLYICWLFLSSFII